METKTCKVCGRELPLESFGRSKLGVHSTCCDCRGKRISKAFKIKKQLAEYELQLQNAKNIRLSSFTPRELMAELKRRGYTFTCEYTATHVISSDTIEI